MNRLKQGKITKLPYWLIRNFYDSDVREGFAGDIEEEFEERIRTRGIRNAIIWISFHAIGALPNILKPIGLWSIAMFSNYMKIALRQIRKHKLYAILNVSGLALGMAVCVLLLQYVVYEIGFDRFHDNLEDIYRLRLTDFAGSHGAAGQTVKDAFPEVKAYVKLNKSNSEGVYSNGDIRFNEKEVFFTTASFFNVFSFRLIEGNPEDALSEVNCVVLTESTAKRYFGDENPLGKSITFKGVHEYKVTGIVRDAPPNSHFHFTMLVSWPTLMRIRGDWIESTWVSCPFYTYLLIEHGIDIENFRTKLKEFFKQKEKEIIKTDRETLDYHLQPLKSIHLHSNLDFEIEKNGDSRTIHFLTVIALLILIIAWINYVNLTTARAVDRAKEIGIRKVVGAFRIQLIRQFLLESLFLNMAAAVLSLVIVYVSMPHFNRLAGTSLSFSLWVDARFWMIYLSLFTSGVFLSGFYPSFILSSFTSAAAIKQKSLSKKGVLRKGLVIFQFAASAILIAGTLTVYKQILFMKSQELGVDIRQTLVIQSPDVRMDRSYNEFLIRLVTFKTELKRIPTVHDAAASTFIPGEDVWVHHVARRTDRPRQDEKELRAVGVDNDFLDFLEVEILAGRDFSDNFRADFRSVILNEEAVRLLGFESSEDAINKQLIYRRHPSPLRIIGVIKNYHQESLKYDFKPMIFTRSLWKANFSIKLNTTDLSETIKSIRDTWYRVFPGSPFDYFFLDAYFDSQYRTDIRFGKISGMFAFLTIFIGCLGIFGLSSHDTVVRTKEIGIRKIFGASLLRILTSLLSDMMRLIYLSFFIALPVAFFYFRGWLGRYAFRTNIGWWFAGIPILLISSVALLAVGFNTIKTARANPVETLRYE